MADAAIISASAPLETPVMFQVASAVPIDRVPILHVVLSTEKCPFFEINVTVTLLISEWWRILQMFSIATTTFFVSPILMVDGIWLAASDSFISRYWEYDAWQEPQGLVDLGITKLETDIKTTTVKAARMTTLDAFFTSMYWLFV